VERHLESQDQGRFYKEIPLHIVYSFDLRRGDVIEGTNVHKLVTNQAGRLAFAGIHDHVGRRVHQICSRHSMTKGCGKMKCILRILIMQFPQHIKHRHVCRYGGATLEKGFICARSNFVDEAPIIRSSA
jgi:hypothetical protein